MLHAVDVKPIRVVLVDDHRSVLWGLTKLIESAAPRMEVAQAVTCSADALAAVEKHQPHIVLLDLDLGREQGFPLISKICNLGPKVLILTGMVDPEMQQHAMIAGASGFICKSEPAEVIIQAVQQVHKGELWLDRNATAKIFNAFRNKTHSRGVDADASTRTLTASERKIIAAVATHKSSPNKYIAGELNISGHTLRNHLASIYSKLDIHRRLDLVLYAMEHGLDQPEHPPGQRSRR
jgi:DNA-binding NarL/FixJ family response regulator